MKFLQCVIILVFTFTGTNAQQHDLKEMDWLIGKWEGKSGNSSFYEAYEFTNDTLTTIKHYTGSDFESVTDEGRVFLEDGAIYHTSGRSKWKLHKADANSWHFTPVANAGNEFIWKFIDDDHWTADIIVRGTTTSYPLIRIK